MSEDKRKSIMILAETIQGEINRMCVTSDLSELNTMHQHARININKLRSMIYDYKFSKVLYYDTDSIKTVEIDNKEF